MAHSYKNIFTIMYMVDNFGNLVGLSARGAIINVSMHKYNTGVLVLAESFRPKFTPRRNQYEKIFFFREDIFKRVIKIVNIDTIQKLGSLFMKGFPKATFECL